jgi:hypothetical protein
MADHGESLARSAPENDIDALPSNSGQPSDFDSGEPDDRQRQHRAIREIVRMDSRVDGIDFNGGSHIETGLLETQPKASCAREQVDSDWPWHTISRC